MSGTPAPEGFTTAFMDWFCATTALNYAEYQSRHSAAPAAARPERAYWLDGLPDATIDRLESIWAVRFPPDYRQFLRHVHAPARPHDATITDVRRVPVEQRPFSGWLDFYDWLVDDKELRRAFDSPLEGLLFDAERKDLWRGSWGERPPTADARTERVRELVALAPKLIPVCGHRYVLAEPCQAGNPVLSIQQSDMIVYGVDLRDYFLREFRFFLYPRQGKPPAMPVETRAQFKTIPFWGEFLY